MATGTTLTLTEGEVRALRMRALLLGPERGGDRSVGQIVEHLGAIQAQDVASSFWSLGVRMPGSVEADVQAATEARSVVRTWPMRGTVHLVPARDAAWMVDLMKAKPLGGGKARREYLGITLELADRSTALLADAVAGGRVLTRDECVAVLEDAGISTAGQVSYHLLWYACQVGVLCQGPQRGKEHTFTLMSEWVPNPHQPSRDEALATMALRYVRGHGPVAVKEMARWTGLGVLECREGIAAAGESLVNVETESGPMVAHAETLDASQEAGAAEASGHLVLPGFDEFMLGYGDRSLFLTPGDLAKVVPGNNGVFQSTLVRHGRVVGIWKRALKAKVAAVAVTPLAKLTAADRKAFEREFVDYARFWGRDAKVAWS